MNSIIWKHRALKQLHRIDVQYHADILAAIRTLTQMPNVSNVRALVHHQYGYRLRVGNFRVLFDWNGAIKIVAIEEIKKRDEQTY